MSFLNLKSTFLVTRPTEIRTLVCYLLFVRLIACVLVFFSFIRAEQKKDVEKISTYECGFEAFEDSRQKFDVRFYLVAILFILFDLEILFILPWALSVPSLTNYITRSLFLTLLLLGLLYEIGRGALNWN